MSLSDLQIWTKLPRFLRSKRTLIGLVIIVAIVFFIGRSNQNEEQIKLATVEQKTITSQVSAAGSIKSKNLVNLKFATSGKIASVLVKEGDYVAAGQMIASLDAEKFEIALRQVEQDLNQADAVLSQVYDDLAKFPSPENFDQKIKRVNAEVAKNKTFDAVLLAQRNLEDTQLTSPISGIVTTVNFVSGQEITPAADFAQIVDVNNLKFVAEVDETDIAKVKVNQDATVTLDAFPNESTQVKISQISAKSTVISTGATAFEVTLPIPKRSEYLVGMNGQAQITVQAVTNTYVVPQEALIDDNFVWVKMGRDFEKKEITVGIQSDTEVEVVSGLNEGDQIAVGNFDKIGKKSLLQKLLKI